MDIDPRRIEVVDEHVTGILRTQTPDQSLALFESLWHEARSLLIDSTRQEHPEWSQAEIEREVAHRLWNAGA